jgi:Zn-dependent protease
MSVDWTSLALALAALALSVSVHESAHAYTAWRLGDPTGKALGRVTLNPIPHVDLFGTILLPVLLWVGTKGQFTFGYAKPVPYNPYALKNPALGSAAIAGMGPVSNLFLAVFGALVVRLVFSTNPALLETRGGELLFTFVALNVSLALFNLIPCPPLDGGTVLAGLLPRRAALAYAKVEWLGMALLIVLMVTGKTWAIIGPPFLALMRLFGRLAGTPLV